MASDVPRKEIDDLYERLLSEAAASGYYLNPDQAFAMDLVESLIVNQERYGYPSCPCRLSSGDRREDADIICPCDYRDPDLTEHGACFCALYVSQAAFKGERAIDCVPERRPPPDRRRPRTGIFGASTRLSYPVWRCRVCGYLCAREEPPEICPICKARKERFDRFV